MAFLETTSISVFALMQWDSLRRAIKFNKNSSCSRFGYCLDHDTTTPGKATMCNSTKCTDKVAFESSGARVVLF